MPQNKKINYIHFDSIASTNTWAKNNAHNLDPSCLTCITAAEQTSGRGRFQRKWISPKGNIYASLFFCVPQDSSYIPNLGQILSLASATFLLEKRFLPEIKWPNDLLVSGKKISGVLGETVILEDKIGVVLGIGINVNMSKELLDSIDQPAVSLAQLSGHFWELEQILEPIVQEFLNSLEILKEKGFAPFQSAYNKLLAFKGKKITCQDGVQIIKGICHSVDEKGRLNLMIEEEGNKIHSVAPLGSMTTLTSGEIL